MNHYPRHVGDYLKKTLGLSLAQDGAYGRALDWYYSHEKPLPAKPDVYDELRCRDRREREAVDVVLAKYFTKTDDGYRHERCDEELERYQARAESARTNGRNGGRPNNRTGTESVISGIPDENRKRTESKASQNHNQNQKIKSNGQPPTPLPAASPPAGVRPELWADWRKARGKKLTATAVRLQTRFLAEQGGDPNAIIEQSLRNGWAGLFPLKTAGPPSRNDAIQAVNAEIWKGPRGHDDRDITGEAERLA